jgi:hypothetical protein
LDQIIEDSSASATIAGARSLVADRPGGRSMVSGGDDFRSGGHRCDQIIKDGGASATIMGARSLVGWSEAVILVATQWQAAVTTFDLAAIGVGGIRIET